MKRSLRDAFDPKNPHILDLPSFWFKPIEKRLARRIETLREKTGMDLERALMALRMGFRLWNASIPIRYATTVIALSGGLMSQCVTPNTQETPPSESRPEHERDPIPPPDNLRILDIPPQRTREKLLRLNDFKPIEETA